MVSVLRMPRPAASLLSALAALALAGCAAGSPAIPAGPAPTPTPEARPERAEPAPPPARRDLLGAAAYDLPVEGNLYVEQEVDFLVGKRRDVIAGWMERADYYEPFVKRILTANGIPTDLHHLAMIESGYVPTARSRAGAVGIWQFMPATGRGMGLRIDEYVDERMDPVRATLAAARHLRALNGGFRDWALSAAAYNAGSGRISRGLRAVGASDFWQLSTRGNLAAETRRYVPRLYAMTIIARDRERWGFSAQKGLVRTFAFDSVQVDLATPLAELARIGRVPVDHLAALNPHLIRGTTPPGRYWVWVPSGSGAAVQTAFQDSEFRGWRGVAPYAVRGGEDLRTVAEMAGISADRLRELNPSLGGRGARPGEKILLPAPAAERLAARAVEPPPAAPKPLAVAPKPSAPQPAGKGDASDTKPVVTPAAEPEPVSEPTPAGTTYTVRAGETLLGIAERFGVAFTEVLAANGMETATVRPGQTLRIPAARPGAPPLPAPETESTPKATGTEHTVQSGETLYGIARRYGTSAAALRSANGLAEEAVIVPGQTLRLPTP